MAFALPYLATAAAAYAGNKLASHGGHSSSHSKSSGSMKKYQTMTHGEKKIYKEILGRINPKALDITRSPLFRQSQRYFSDFLKKSPDEQYAAFEKPIMSQFNQQIVPELSTRFAGLGGLSSSGFQQALGAAGANLSERLGMLKENLQSNLSQQQLQAAGMGANLSQMPVSNMQNTINSAFATPSFGYQYTPQQPSAWQSLLPGLGQGLGSIGTLLALQKSGFLG